MDLIDLLRSTDRFATNSNDARVGGLLYDNHHGDQHYMVFHPTNAAIAYTGSDGGVHKTVNTLVESVAWSSLNNGYNTVFCQTRQERFKPKVQRHFRRDEFPLFV